LIGRGRSDNEIIISSISPRACRHARGDRRQLITEEERLMKTFICGHRDPHLSFHRIAALTSEVSKVYTP
jgi:hypothetical protein